MIQSKSGLRGAWHGGSLEQVQKTLSQLTSLYPESLSYDDGDDAG